MIKQVKRNNLESSDWLPSIRKEKSSEAEQGTVRLSEACSLKRPGSSSMLGSFAYSSLKRTPSRSNNSVQKHDSIQKHNSVQKQSSVQKQN